MSSSSADTIHGLAIQIETLIKTARAMPADANTLPLAKQAGRVVTESMKLVPSITAIPPVLLSCAMALCACTGRVKERSTHEIVRVPDWGAIGYDDYRIMQHPQRKKAMIWMASLDVEKDVGMVNVSKDGINWQAILGKEVDKREVLVKNEHGVGARMSLQSLGKEVEELEKTLRMDKPRSFGPAKRKAADISNQGIKTDKEKGDAASHNGKDREATSGQKEVVPATKNAERHWTDARGRKRRRMSHTSAKHDEYSDGDMQIDQLLESPSRLEVSTANNAGPSALKRDRGSSVGLTKPSAAELSETAAEVVRDSRCTPCRERGLNCIIGYSKKTGNRLNSCGECSMTKRKCVYGQEPESVARGSGRAMSRAKSRRPSQTRTRLPTKRGSKWRVDSPTPAQSRRSVTRGFSPVVAHIEASSAPPIPALSGAAINLIEERLVTLEAALAKLNTTIEQLWVDHDVLRQKVVPPHSTVLLSHDPPLPPVQIAMPLPPSFKPQLTPPAALSSSSTMPSV